MYSARQTEGFNGFKTTVFDWISIPFADKISRQDSGMCRFACSLITLRIPCLCQSLTFLMHKAIFFFQASTLFCRLLMTDCSFIIMHKLSLLLLWGCFAPVDLGVEDNFVCLIFFQKLCAFVSSECLVLKPLWSYIQFR